MPDIFVPRDTIGITSYLNNVVNNGIIYQFALEYTNKHRKELSQFKDYGSLLQYLKRKPLLDEFVIYAASKGVKPRPVYINISRKIINNQLHAYIARNLLGDEAFYPILMLEDKTFLKAVDILDELEDEKSEELIQLMDKEAKKDIDLIQSYDDDEIGSKMTTNYVTLTLNLTIKQAMKRVVEQAADNDNISTLYVLDSENKFYGAIDLTDLIVAREYVVLETLVTTSYPFVYDHETVDDCIEDLKDYSEDSIPVLDRDQHILGVITSQDLLEVVDEEMGEDYAKLAALTSEEDLEEPLLESLKKRIPWLVILLMLGLGVSSVTGMFEHVIATLPIIVSFQSVILGMSGNVGTQSLAVTIRVLTDEELTLKQQLGFVLKELKVGFFNGMIIGSISFMITGLFIWLAKGQTVVNAFAMSGCIGGALWLAMIISSVVGTIIPIFFTKIKVDPAVASGPLISTVNDLVAVVTYYGLAWTLLLNIVHMA